MRVWHIHPRRTAVWLVGFSGPASYMKSMTCILLLFWAAPPLWTKMLGPLGFKTFASMVLISIMNLCFPPREHTPSHAQTTVNMQIPQTTLEPCPAAQATAGNTVMRVWHTHTWCTVLHTAVQQYTYNSKPTSLGKVHSSPRGDGFESDNDKKTSQRDFS